MSRANNSDSKRQRVIKFVLRLTLVLAILAALIVAFYFIYKALGWDRFSDRKEFQAYIASFGAWGPVLFILLSFLQVTFIPLPSTVTILAGSFLFGAGMSFLYSFIGIFMGSCLAFWLGRWIGKPFVYFVAGDKGMVDKWLKRTEKKGNVVLFFIFLFPFFPDDLFCALAGITKMRFLTFVLMQIPTRAIAIGYNLFFMSGEIIPFHGWGIAVITIVCILALAAFIICYIKADQLDALFMRFINKISKKKAPETEADKQEGDSNGNDSPASSE